jgi:hypothetical protein
MSAANLIKLDTVQNGAEPNVQVDWNEGNTGSDAHILNKPENLSDFTDDLGAVDHIADSAIHITSLERDQWNLAEPNVQSDWDETDSGLATYINNKPTLGAAAALGVDSVPTNLSTNLVESQGLFNAFDEVTIDPSTGFTRFGDDTIRLVQGGNTINITDVPRLDPNDGKVLASQSRSLTGGATHVFQLTTDLEASINGGTPIPQGDFVYIANVTDPNNAMWIAATALSGPGWDFATAAAAYDIIDITTGANSYTQTQINNAFANQNFVAGDGVSGGGSLTFAGSTITFNVDVGNGVRINSGDQSLEIDDLIGCPTGTLYTP